MGRRRVLLVPHSWAIVTSQLPTGTGGRFYAAARSHRCGGLLTSTYVHNYIHSYMYLVGKTSRVQSISRYSLEANLIWTRRSWLGIVTKLHYIPEAQESHEFSTEYNFPTTYLLR